MDSKKAEKLKKVYDVQKPEDKLRVVNSINDQLIALIHAQSGTLPTIGGISTAMLIVATFNPQLLPLTILVRILISILMLVIPLSLLLYLIRINGARERGEELYELYTDNKIPRRYSDSILDNSPYIFTTIICLVIITILLCIWRVF